MSRPKNKGKPYDASDAGQIDKAKDDEKDRQRDVEFVMSQPRGRRLMYDIIFDTCHVSARSHVPGDTDSTGFNEGSRCVGEALLENLRVNHFDQYMLMLKENHGES